MKRYEQRSSPIASDDPCRQATIVGMYEVQPNDGSSYRHFYLASEADARIADLELAAKENARYSTEMREEFERRGERIAELEKQVATLETSNRRLRHKLDRRTNH